jgi:twinkle protein
MRFCGIAIIANSREENLSAKILGPIGVKAFEARGIDPETAVRLGAYTGKPGIDGGQVIPDAKGSIVVFPFEENGVVVNEKYRGPGKKFWQTTGGRRTFWNSDVMDDPALLNGSQALIITEGEIDAYTAIDCGHPFTVSVPDGAPPPPKEGAQPREGESDQAGKFEFMWNNRDRLKRIKRFIIAVDNDAPGQYLANELVRRLSAAKCLFVTYPAGCKDLNDVRMQHGAEAVTGVLNAAQPYPVKGLFSLSDYPDAPQVATYSTGWATVDELMKVFTPSFTVVTGIPGHGKSTWVMNLIINVAEQYGWKAAIFSPEMPVVPHLRDKMRRIVGRWSISDLKPAELEYCDKWINEHLVFIEHRVDEEEDLSLEWLIERATDAVLRHGVRMLLIDPWNEIEHAKRRDESMTEYISRALRMLKKFQMRYDLALFVVAHPTKDVGAAGKPRVPSLYDVDGSAAWFNKPDIGVVIDRPDNNVDESMVYITKVRFEGTGQKGAVRMNFDRFNSRYDLLGGFTGSKKHYGAK